MASSAWRRKTIKSLIASGAITGHKDGNFGSLYPRASEFVAAGVPFLTAKSIRDGKLDIKAAPRLAEDRADTLKFGFVETNDVLLSHNATIGRVAVVPDFEGRLLVGTSLTYFRLNPTKFSARYFAAYLSGADFQNQLTAVMSHSTRNQVPITAQRDLTVVVPPLAVQHAIAGVIGALDDKIEQNRRMARVLERMAQTIFQAWFVDFEPVRAKADGATSFPSMPQHVFDTLPTRFADSQIGPVPEGWGPGTVGDMAQLSKTQIDPQEHPEELFEHYSIPAFDAGSGAALERGSAIKSTKFLVRDECVLLSKLNPRIPRVWLPPPPSERRQIASTEFLVLTPRADIDRSYLYCQLRQPRFREDLTRAASGTSNSHQRVRPVELLTKPIVLSPPALPEGFAFVARPLFDAIALVDRESSKLVEVRGYLLPKLLAGDVRAAVEPENVA